VDAIAWLLRMESGRPWTVLRRAEWRGLITNCDGTWRVNRHVVVRCLKLHHPRKNAPSALTLYGLGELLARGTRATTPHFRFLPKMSHRRAIKFLETACAIGSQSILASPFEEVTSRNMFMTRQLTSEVRQNARAYLVHPPRPKPNLFGLHVIIDAFLATHPRELGQWLAAGQHSAVNNTVLAKLAHRLVLSDSANMVHREVLKTGLPLLQAMTATALADNPWSGKKMSFASMITFCRDVGVRSATAFNLAMVNARQTCIQRRQARHELAKTEKRLSLLGKHPQLAAPGKTSDEELEQLSVSLRSAHNAIRAADLAVDQLVADMAQQWPNAAPIDADIFSDSLGEDTAEIMTRLANLLGADHTKTADFLDFVLDGLSRFIGLGAGPKIFSETFNPSQEDVERHFEWAVKALSLRYASDKKGTGWRTGQLLAPLAKATEKILRAPYSAMRWGNKYQSALTRRACSVLFAIRVARDGNDDERQERVELMRLALDQAEATLACDRSDVDTHGWTDRLGSDCIEMMRMGYAPDRRTQWSMDRSLPPFVRTLAVWSDAALIRADPIGAEALFEKSAVCHVSWDVDSTFPRAVSLLDLALATGARAHAEDVTNLALSIWPRIYASYEPTIDSIWSDLHESLHEALMRNGNPRRSLLQDPDFAHSHCVDVIKTLRSLSDTEQLAR
jgi:hypothetical protein